MIFLHTIRKEEFSMPFFLFILLVLPVPLALGARTGRRFSEWLPLYLGGVAGQVGDLTASLVKRHCGIKDFGSIFPGHGGIMDRMDSVLFTLVVVCAYCLLYV